MVKKSKYLFTVAFGNYAAVSVVDIKRAGACWEFEPNKGLIERRYGFREIPYFRSVPGRGPEIPEIGPHTWPEGQDHVS